VTGHYCRVAEVRNVISGFVSGQEFTRAETENQKTGLQALSGKETPLNLLSMNFWDRPLAGKG
jgi:hypothetical protein